MFSPKVEDKENRIVYTVLEIADPVTCFGNTDNCAPLDHNRYLVNIGTYEDLAEAQLECNKAPTRRILPSKFHRSIFIVPKIEIPFQFPPVYPPGQYPPQFPTINTPQFGSVPFPQYQKPEQHPWGFKEQSFGFGINKNNKYTGIKPMDIS